MSAAPVLEEIFEFSISVLSGNHKGEEYTFSKSTVSLGRGLENEIVLSKDSKVSREHLQILIKSDKIVIKNLSEKNFVLVNGIVILEESITEPCEIVLGESKLKLTPKKKVVNSSNRSNEKKSSTYEEKRKFTEINSNEKKNSASENDDPQKNHLSVVAPEKDKFPSNNPLAASPSAGPSKAIEIEPQKYKPKLNKFFSSKASASPRSNQPPIPPSINQQDDVGAVKKQFSSKRKPEQKSSFLINTISIFVLLALGYFLVTENNKKKLLSIRDSIQVQEDIKKSVDEAEKLMKFKEGSGKNSLEYQFANEHFIKGFRDYRQGQYGRALTSFQAALSFFPKHELALKYHILSETKQNQVVQLLMIQAKKYMGQGNYRLCSSSYRKVMIIIKDDGNSLYKEAKTYFRECELLLEANR